MANDDLFCSQCGAQSSVAAEFCEKCGARITSGTASPVAAGNYPAAVAAAHQASPALPGGYCGGFWIRVVAYLIDQLLFTVAVLPFFLVLIFPSFSRLIRESEANQQQPGPEVVFTILGSMGLFFVIAFCGSWLYEALLTSSSWQGTVGKRIMRLKVTDDFGNKLSFGRSTARFFAKILSGWVMYVGFIMVAFMERKRGLHDVICNTQVLHY